MALIGITLGAMLIGGISQLVSNAIAGKTGDELWRGVAGASIGTGVNALALCLTIPTGGASIFIASGLGSMSQTGVDVIETMIRGEKINWADTALSFGINFSTTVLGNMLGSYLAPTNPGWLQPKFFFSVFTRPYGQRILAQTLLGATYSGLVNYVSKYNWEVALRNLIEFFFIDEARNELFERLFGE